MKYIAICGTVGAGKTTLLGRLIDRLGPRAAFHEERPQDNPYIFRFQTLVVPLAGELPVALF